MSAVAPVARLCGVTLAYGKARALDGVTLELPAGVMAGLIGPDGVGKSSLLALVAGARRLQQGSLEVLGGDMAKGAHRRAVCPRIAYLPQGLGKNLYATLSVEENLQVFARLFGLAPAERRRRIDAVTAATGLHPFLARPAGKLSGGMKQKLGLCCALIHDPDLLILDEPTTGVDPLSRAQFWALVDQVRAGRPGMSVLVATAYMEEARRFDWLAAMKGGRVLATGSPAGLLARTGAATLEQAFMALLPAQPAAPAVPPAPARLRDEVAIEARDLTCRFGGFTAVDRVSFRIRRGEIFGFLGSNGCGKTTTMKMLTGLLPPTSGQAWLFGQPVDARDLQVRRRVGYMSQSFSLYGELTVRQNLELHARLFHVPEAEVRSRSAAMAARFGLVEVMDALPGRLPLGMRQRLSLAVAVVHKPELLILDEPTSGADPAARDEFWRLMLELARVDGVTIFISTHFMDEAQRCDRISLMHAGRVLDRDSPAAIVARRGAASLEEAFIACLVEAQGEAPAAPPLTQPGPAPRRPGALAASLGRVACTMWREALELRRDPMRATLALAGSLLLMFVLGYGISMDVENLRYAVLDRDQSALSQDYTSNIAGSRYFTEQAPLRDYEELDRRMRSGELALALEIPAGFARDVGRGHPVQLGAWVDGAMPQRAETASGYVQGMHQQWLARRVQAQAGAAPVALARVETRFRYNPELESLPAMLPAVIPLLLLLLPAMLTALAVVREKELGSIVNLYVTPIGRVEFLLGKQLPYVALGLLNFLLMCAAAVTIFGVPVTGSFPSLLLAALLFCFSTTGIGLLASAFTRSQVAAMFFATLGSIIPAVQFSGMINPVSALEGAGRVVGQLYPATYMFIASRGIFSKGLGIGELAGAFWPLAVAGPVILCAAVLLLKKQEG